MDWVHWMCMFGMCADALLTAMAWAYWRVFECGLERETMVVRARIGCKLYYVPMCDEQCIGVAI